MTTLAPERPVSTGELTRLVYGDEPPLTCVLLPNVALHSECGAPAAKVITLECLFHGIVTVPICAKHLGDLRDFQILCDACYIPVVVASV